jgi:tungstate transport system substrate-binding protein
MRKLFLLMTAIAVTAGLVACAQTPAATQAPQPVQPTQPVITNPVIRMSTTTSVNDSGLLPYLQPTFEKETGYKLEVTSAGTGAAIEKARKGDADLLLVHSKSLEDVFVNEGFDEKRISFMYNSYVIVGPRDDPAGVKNTKTAAEAFKAIADKGAKFITRGDNSGTNTAEVNIWKATGIDPKGKDWYVNIGAGMGQALTIASEQQAYTLSDKATFLSTKTQLEILLGESADMKNTYSLIAVSLKRFKDTNYEGALAFINWITSARGQKLISQYGVDKYGQQLFFILK